MASSGRALITTRKKRTTKPKEDERQSDLILKFVKLDDAKRGFSALSRQILSLPTPPCFADLVAALLIAAGTPGATAVMPDRTRGLKMRDKKKIIADTLLASSDLLPFISALILPSKGNDAPPRLNEPEAVLATLPALRSIGSLRGLTVLWLALHHAGEETLAREAEVRAKEKAAASSAYAGGGCAMNSAIDVSTDADEEAAQMDIGDSGHINFVDEASEPEPSLGLPSPAAAAVIQGRVPPSPSVETTQVPAPQDSSPSPLSPQSLCEGGSPPTLLPSASPAMSPRPSPVSTPALEREAMASLPLVLMSPPPPPSPQEPTEEYTPSPRQGPTPPSPPVIPTPPTMSPPAPAPAARKREDPTSRSLVLTSPPPSARQEKMEEYAPSPRQGPTPPSPAVIPTPSIMPPPPTVARERKTLASSPLVLTSPSLPSPQEKTEKYTPSSRQGPPPASPPPVVPTPQTMPPPPPAHVEAAPASLAPFNALGRMFSPEIEASNVVSVLGGVLFRCGVMTVCAKSRRVLQAAAKGEGSADVMEMIFAAMRSKQVKEELSRKRVRFVGPSARIPTHKTSRGSRRLFEEMTKRHPVGSKFVVCAESPRPGTTARILTGILSSTTEPPDAHRGSSSWPTSPVVQAKIHREGPDMTVEELAAVNGNGDDGQRLWAWVYQ